VSIDENKMLAQRYFEELVNERNPALASEIVVAQHSEDIQRLIIRLYTAFPDFHIAIEDQIAERDRVVTRFTASGTHLGVWQSPLGMHQPTGKRFEHEGIRIFRVIDGRLAETWGGADTLSQLQQLGVLPLSEMPLKSSDEE
jgi:predicted ester cyclase